MPKRLFGLVLLLTVVSALLAWKSETDTPVPYQFPDLKYFPQMPVSDTNPVTVEGVKLGRHLFYDPILSRDSTFSCASCHKQENAFSDSPNKLSEGIDGALTRRNTMALFNLAWYEAFFWDGRAATIESQVFEPVRDHLEMDLEWYKAVQRIQSSTRYKLMFEGAFPNSKIDSTLVTKAIGQFLRTLISSNSLYDKVLRGETHFDSATYAGFVLANDQSMADCLHCHPTDATALGTTGTFSNNGLETAEQRSDYSDKGLGGVSGNKSQIGQFKIPSLRNVALTAPYMHDGRFNTLDEVLDFYSEGVHASINIDSKMTHARFGGVHLTNDEKKCIIKFLEALTDSSFISNPEFGSPFLK